MTREGFTLVEVLLSVALLAILVGLSTPLYRTFSVRNDLDVSTYTLVESLRRAKVLSQAVDGNITWGVRVQTTSTVLFKGASFASRDTSYDEIFLTSASVVPSGLAEVVFTKFTGIPQATGTSTFTSDTGDVWTVTVNSVGMVDH